MVNDEFEKKCENCFWFHPKYFCNRDCCTVDEDDDEGTLHYANSDDEPCDLWEYNLTI